MTSKKNKLTVLEKAPTTPWYRDGLHFECTGCGRCCTGQPGYVWVTKKEIANIAQLLLLSVEEMARRYVRKTVFGYYSLLEYTPSYDCVFFRDKRCTIYSARPTQCRTFPWWPENLRSKHTWKETAHHCEGISDDAPLVPYEKIQEELSRQEQYIAHLSE